MHLKSYIETTNIFKAARKAESKWLEYLRLFSYFAAVSPSCIRMLNTATVMDLPHFAELPPRPH